MGCGVNVVDLPEAGVYAGDSQASELSAAVDMLVDAGLCVYASTGSVPSSMLEVTVRSTLERFDGVWCPVALLSMSDGPVEAPMLVLDALLHAGWLLRPAVGRSWQLYGPGFNRWVESRSRLAAPADRAEAADAADAGDEDSLSAVVAALGFGTVSGDGVMLSAAEAVALRDMLHPRRTDCSRGVRP